MAEALVGALTPAACREEVLGDLHERYRSPRQYLLDVSRTIPLVVLSRVRRTADPHVLLMQVLALYGSTIAAAWFADRTLLGQQWGLLRLLIPAATAIPGLLLEDAYASSGRRSPFTLIRGPITGLGLALLAQGVLRAGNPDLALPDSVALYGFATCLLLSSAVRLLFPPPADQPRPVHAPPLWADEQSGGSFGGTVEEIRRVLKNVAALVFRAKEDWSRSDGGGKDNAMKFRMRTAIICAALIGAAGMLWWGSASRSSPRSLTYSQFMEELRAGQVASVVLIESHSGAVPATCSLKDGKTVRTVLPSDYREALAAMQEKLVNVEIRDSASQGLRLLGNAAPFLLLLGVWIVLMMGKFPTDFGHRPR